MGSDLAACCGIPDMDVRGVIWLHSTVNKYVLAVDTKRRLRESNVTRTIFQIQNFHIWVIRLEGDMFINFMKHDDPNGI
jgi:hypothetical protein